MHRALHFRRWAGVLCGASLLTLAPSAPAQILTKTLTYTRFSGPPNNVRQVLFTYNAGLGTTGFSNYTTITTTPGADGVLFAPDSDLIVGGQADAVHKVVIATGLFATVTAGGAQSYHVMLDTSGTIVWTAGIPGFLASVPLQPFANGTAHPLSGDDTAVTHLGFAGNKVYYSASFPSGLGNFGTIDLATFTTTRLFTLVPWAHGMTFDCYTDKVIVFANNSVVQIDPATDLIVSSLTVPTPSLQLDQGTSDGDGHLYIASNTGHMLFLDITVSQLIGTPDFADTPFLEAGLDDLAPECGLGSLPATPFSQGYWKKHPDDWPLQTMTLGCQTYTKAQCLVLMQTPIGGDASLTLARQLIGAKLNVANNGLNWPLLVPLINQADTLLCGFAGQLPYGVPPSSPVGQQMTAIAQTLASLTQ
ncbi:MAG TPA: hypothetical protein VFD82_00275 [Planctomycetota bacterium]|nr:hypothetical protein [Planctomycetota bacterium]